ncbi:hypothetical protein HPB51_012386 [Rhipicephalus microplus]|uniref:Chitin-binding type-2 domain-containing protein n=1 Tax=Rhipicephalus microplus TaxID=6941 RepID=A0A9J6E9A9_RHIMP|nr:hypothetical protein HPB51_012386 [Rhipicephalus microplus]
MEPMMANGASSCKEPKRNVPKFSHNNGKYTTQTVSLNLSLTKQPTSSVGLREVFLASSNEADLPASMKTVAVIAFVLCAVAAQPIEQGPVQAESPESRYLGLPAGADGIVRKIDISFSCADRELGYYADIGNDCKIFHVCNPMVLSDGQLATMQYSFVCPNGTLFDQQTFTCTVPPGTAPCVQAESFYYLNRHLAPPAPSKPSVGDNSVVRPASYYGGKSS